MGMRYHVDKAVEIDFDVNKRFHAIMDSVCKIHFPMGEFNCGFTVSLKPFGLHNNCILTCAVLLQNARLEDVTIEFPNGDLVKLLPEKFCIINRKLNFAIIACGVVPGIIFFELGTSDKKTFIQEQIVHYVWWEEECLIMASGILQDVVDNHFHTDAPTRTGSSGCAVWSSRWTLMGIHLGCVLTSFDLRIDRIIEYIEELGLIHYDPRWWKIIHKKAMLFLDRNDVPNYSNLQTVSVDEIKWMCRLGKKNNPTTMSQYYGCEGSVYLAAVPPNFHHIAIKIVYNYERDAASRDLLERIEQESTIVKDLNTVTARHVFRLFTYFVGQFDSKKLPNWDAPEAQPKSIFLFMEFCEGNLKDLIRNIGKLLEFDALIILLQLCRAVRFLQDHDVVHADIKLDNVLFDKQHRVVLADFGCALKLENLKMNYQYPFKGGNPIGFPPEVKSLFKGGRVIPTIIDWSKSDIWALGCIAYELVGLPHPWMKNDCRSTTEIPPMPDCSPGYIELTSGLLAHSFDDRLDVNAAIKKLEMLLWPQSIGKKEEIALFILKKQHEIAEKGDEILVSDYLCIEHIWSLRTPQVLEILETLTLQAQNSTQKKNVKSVLTDYKSFDDGDIYTIDVADGQAGRSIEDFKKHMAQIDVHPIEIKKPTLDFFQIGVSKSDLVKLENADGKKSPGGVVVRISASFPS